MRNPNCCNLFKGARVSHGFVAYSDHISLILDIERVTNHRAYGNTKPFRFEAMWIGNVEYKKIIEENWKNRMTNELMEFVLHYLHGDNLKQWNIISFGHVQGNLRRVQVALKIAQDSDQSLLQS